MNEPGASRQEFDLLRGLVHRQIGVYLADGKRALLESRLRRRMRELGISSFMTYYQRLAREDRATEELQHLVDAITTNTTSFFRDPVHFEFLGRELVPRWAKRTTPFGPPRIRLWSAACSSGQEAYSIAAVLHYSLSDAARGDAKVLGTDVSERALGRARSGKYDVKAVTEIPPCWRGAFVRTGVGKDAHLRVSREVMDLVVFRPLNLIAPSYPFRGRFDAIFCRNVLIYFDAATREALVERLACCLLPGAHLFLGLAESLVRIPAGLRSIGHSIYQRAEGG